MSLVGPRPEDPAFVDLSDPLHRRVFTAKPGITGLAQLHFHDEAELLLGTDPERRYRDEILPAKLRLDADYLDRRTTWLDVSDPPAHRRGGPRPELAPARRLSRRRGMASGLREAVLQVAAAGLVAPLAGRRSRAPVR